MKRSPADSQDHLRIRANRRYWVRSLDHEENELWLSDDISLDEAIGHFLRIRRERGLGYDLEEDMNREAGLLD